MIKVLLSLTLLLSWAWGASEVRIGVLAFISKEQTRIQWQETLTHLSHALPHYRFTLIPLTYTEIDEALTHRRIDLLLTNPSHYIALEKPHHLSVVATIKHYENHHWISSFGGVIVVRAEDRRIRTLGDIPHYRVAAVDADSLGGLRAQLYELKHRGIALPSSIDYTGMPHTRVIERVLHHQDDVGFVRTGVIESMIRAGTLDPDALRIIHPLGRYRSTLLYPEWPLIRLPWSDPTMLNALLPILFTPSPHPHEGEIGWGAPTDYSQVQQLARLLNLPPYDFEWKDIYEHYRGFILTILILGIATLMALISQIYLHRRLQKNYTLIVEADRKLQTQYRKNALLLHLSVDGIHILDKNGRLVQMSEAFCTMLGYRCEEMIGMSVYDWDSALDLQHIDEVLHSPTDHTTRLLTRHRRKDGITIDVEVIYTRIMIDDEIFIYCSGRDITQDLRDEAQLRLSATVYQYSSDAIAITDEAGELISINPALVSLMDETFESLQQRHFLHHHALYHSVWHSVALYGSWEGEITDRTQSGVLFSQWLSIRSVYDERGLPYRRIVTFSPISEHKEAQQKIWYQAHFDPLTGLLNRSMLIQQLTDTLIHLQHPFALLYIDLDQFKEVNDTLGHDTGDRLLMLAAQRIKGCIEPHDLIGRLGGDEFMVIVMESWRAKTIAQNLITHLARPFEIDEQRLHISASIGITIAPDDASEVEILMKYADQAMYAAKSAGRNTYRYFTLSMYEAMQERLLMIDRLRQAILEDAFVMLYQPILQHNQLTKAEALIRWRRSDGTLISPDVFIPLAEETGLIIPIGEQIFAHVLDQVASWRKRFDPTFQISINKSPIEFHNEGAQCHMLLDALSHRGLSADAIMIEITEGVLIENTAIVAQKLLFLQQHNIMVALDDFGTGYSSLAYLKKFDIDVIKIDRLFVQHISEDENDRILCQAMIMMAHQLGIEVIAEGVETYEQYTLLTQLQCDGIQGYWVAKPLLNTEFERQFWETKC